MPQMMKDEERRNRNWKEPLTMGWLYDGDTEYAWADNDEWPPNIETYVSFKDDNVKTKKVIVYGVDFDGKLLPDEELEVLC